MWLTNLKTYLKFLSRNKLYSFVTIFGFAVSLMFVFLLGVYVKQELSVDNFQKKKDRIYLLAESTSKATFANPVADFVKDKCPEVESFTRIVTRSITACTNNNQKITVKALFADSAFFNIFSFKLLEGNASQVLATKQTAVVTRSFALKTFHNENPIGKTLLLDTLEVTITGIMDDFPQNTQIPKSDVVFNYQLIENYWGNDILTSWDNSSFGIYFLARQGTSLPAKAPLLLRLFKKDYWLFKLGYEKDVVFIPLQKVYFSEIVSYCSNIKTNSKTLVTVYLGIAILILLVAMLNYINLSVAHAGSRGKEAAIKKLLGSHKKNLIFQFISESVIMTLFSFLIGLLLAFLAEPFFNNLLNTELNLPGQFNLSFVLWLAIGILITGLVSGLIPALAISRFEPIEVVKGTYIRKVKAIYSKLLITFQYTIAIALLICSAFMVRQTIYMQNFDLGFNRNNLFVMDNVLPKERLAGLKDKLLSISGVEKVSFVSGSPLDGGDNRSYDYKGAPLSFQLFIVDSTFFDIFGIKIKSTGIIPSKNTLWVNQKGFDALQPDKNSTFTLYKKEKQIAGITSDFHFKSLHDPIGLVQLRLRDKDDGCWTIITKIASGADAIKTANFIKQAYSKYNGNEPFDSYFADETIQKWYEKDAKASKIIMAFTVLTIVILLMGILAMSLYFVRQKEKEIAIRKINGATESEILRMLNVGFVRWILTGFIIAVPIAYIAMQHWLRNFAYKIQLSWWMFALAGVAVLLLSVIFVSWQSWRAATANPVESLKGE